MKYDLLMLKQLSKYNKSSNIKSEKKHQLHDEADLYLQGRDSYSSKTRSRHYRVIDYVQWWKNFSEARSDPL